MEIEEIAAPDLEVCATGPLPQSVSDDYDLLCWCVRQALSFGADDAKRTPVTRISDPQFIALARRHDVLPLVFGAVRARHIELAPQTSGWLQRECHRISAFNLFLTSELIGIVRNFVSAGVETLPFKGPVFAADYYPSLSLRRTADLDIFVPEGQIRPALEVLARLGLRAAEKSKNPGKDFRANNKDVECYHPQTGVHVELHWSACEPFFDRKLSRLDPFERTVSTQAFGHNFQVIAPEEALIFLALHGLRHRWDRLKWIVDIACVLRRRSNLDWDRVFQKVNALARRRMLLLPVQLAHRLLDAPVPREVVRQMEKESGVNRLVAIVESAHRELESAVPALSTAAIVDRGRLDQFRLQSRDNWASRLALIWQLFLERLKPTEQDEGPERGSPIGGMLAWIARPLRIWRVYGIRCAFRWLRDLFAAVTNNAIGRDR